MKRYIAVLIGIVVLLGLGFGLNKFIKRHRIVDVHKQSSVQMKVVSGDVNRVFEGDNKINYSFEIPETATTSIDMDGALIKVIDSGNSYATIYISYEGARGYSAVNYISEIIAPHVSVINSTDVEKIGEYYWQNAESEGSKWHIATVNNGNWLVIVENKKSSDSLVQKTLESLKLK